MGGTETHLTRVLPLLKSDEFSPIVITLTHRGALADSLEASGIPVYQPSSLVRRLQRIPILSRVLGPLATISYLCLRFIRTPAAMTCFYLPSSYYLGMCAALITGDAKRTLMFRRSLNDYSRDRPVLRAIEHRLHRIVANIAGNSQAVIRQLMNEEGVPPEKLTLIYNGIDLSGFGDSVDGTKTRKKLGITPSTTVLSIVANLIPYKGHQDLIDALALIKEEIKDPWTLLCVGTGIGNRPDLVERVVKHGLVENIKWLGQRRDVARILLASDIGLLVSHQEGFSNSLLEGMAAGLPMIVTNVGGNPEAIIHKQCGLVVPPAEPAALARAILSLVNDSETARRYGEAARLRVQEQFSMEACVENYQRLFNRIIAQ